MVAKEFICAKCSNLRDLDQKNQIFYDEEKIQKHAQYLTDELLSLRVCIEKVLPKLQSLIDQSQISSAQKIQRIFEKSAWLLTCYKNAEEDVEKICRFNSTYNSSEYKGTLKDTTTVQHNAESASDLPFDIKSDFLQQLSIKSKEDDLLLHYDSMDSLVLPPDPILQDQLCQLIDPTGHHVQLNLLYRGSAHGFEAATFHQRCNYRGATLTLVRAKEVHGGAEEEDRPNGESHIFGGYTNI